MRAGVATSLCLGSPSALEHSKVGIPGPLLWPPPAGPVADQGADKFSTQDVGIGYEFMISELCGIETDRGGVLES